MWRIKFLTLISGARLSNQTRPGCGVSRRLTADAKDDEPVVNQAGGPIKLPVRTPYVLAKLLGYSREELLINTLLVRRTMYRRPMDYLKCVVLPPLVGTL